MDVSSYAEKISRAYKGGKITANHARKLCGLPPMQDPGMDELVQMYDETVFRRHYSTGDGRGQG